jgi:hypothetical protein
MLLAWIGLRSSVRFDERSAALTHELAFPILVFLWTNQPVIEQRYKKIDRQRQNIRHRNQTRQRGQLPSGDGCHGWKKTYQPKNDGRDVRQLPGWVHAFDRRL